MAQKGVVIKANSNFHHSAGLDLFAGKEERFKEYRKRWIEWPESFHVGDFPLFIDVEVTSACNLKCPFCATTYRADAIRKGFMKYDTVKKVIDEGADKGLYGVKFNIRGEPLLHPEIDKFVAYAKKKKLVDVYFNTNALLLDEDMSRRLIDAGLDRLSVSVEGYTKDVYDRYRVGGDFDMMMGNIRGIQAMKKSLGVGHPKVRVQTVMLPEIVPIFEEYKRFWSERVDEVAYLDYKEMKGKKKSIRFPWACPQLWQRLAIWWDGTVLPCNHDDEGSSALGNIHKLSISDIWKSDALQKMRDAHMRGASHEVPACDGCYLRDSEILKIEKGGKSA